MIEIECSNRVGDALLKGTACLPQQDGKFPLVLMIHGSGQLDRDENTRFQKLNVFNAVAHHLASNGIASVRYDKRGCGDSGGDIYSTGHFDLVDDAVSWFDALDQFEFCDPSKKYLLGHSEGSIIVPQVNLKRPSVAGLILLCPFIEPMETILRNQATILQDELDNSRGISGTLSRILFKFIGQPIDAQNKLIEKIKNSTKDSIFYGFRKLEAKWLRDLLTLDPKHIYQGVTAPILAIAGEKDLQCNPKDLDDISRTVNVEFEGKLIPNLTHILRFDEDPPAMSHYYTLLKKPVEPIVLECISNWITKRS